MAKKGDLAWYPLQTLCDLVIDYSYSYEDLAELIEDKAYDECSNGGGTDVIAHLIRLSEFFESMENKNEENLRDLADIYLLIGEFSQCINDYAASITWFEKAILVDDTYDVPYHSIAHSYLRLNNGEKAIQSLTMEIQIAPGNYYTYLLLADLYEQWGRMDEVEQVLNALLSRDPSNIQALHKLIKFYEKKDPHLDVSLLRRRLIQGDKQLVKLDLIIWTYHMCEEKNYEGALRFLDEREKESPEISVVHLLKAHIYSKQRYFVKRRQELMKFKKLNHGREEFMRTKIEEFKKIFDQHSAEELEKKLALISLVAHSFK